jgi:hypothetical protein
MRLASGAEMMRLHRHYRRVTWASQTSQRNAVDRDQSAALASAIGTFQVYITHAPYALERGVR